MVVEGYTGNGSINKYAESNLHLVNNIGLGTPDLIMSSCRAKSASDQAN